MINEGINGGITLSDPTPFVKNKEGSEMQDLKLHHNTDKWH